MLKRSFASLALAALLGLACLASATAQTPITACTHGTGAFKDFLNTNLGLDCLDNSANASVAVVMDLDGSTSPTLATMQSGFHFEFTGLLTASENILLPAGWVGSVAVENSSSGAFPIVIKYAAGATVTVEQNEILGIYADATDVKLVGGGTSLDITGLTAVDPLDVDGDELIVYDLSATANKKATSQEILEAVNDLIEDATSVSGDKYLKITGGVANWINHDDLAIGGSGVTVTVDNPSRLVVIEARDESAASSADFTFDDTLYDAVFLRYSEVVTSANAVDLYLRVSVDGGSTWPAGVSDYKYAAWAVTHNTSGAGGSTGASGDADDSKIVVSQASGMSFVATEPASGEIILTSPDMVATKNIAFHHWSYNALSRSDNVIGSGAYVGATTGIDGLRLIASSGTLTGHFILMGILKNPPVVTTVDTVQTTNATTTVLSNQAVAAESAVTVEVTVQGREAATGDVIDAKLMALFQNEAGTTAKIGSTTSVATHNTAGAAAWTITLDANDTADEWEANVTGEAAHTIEWTSRFETITQID